MGRGDRKTRKGKIAIRSYGNIRPHTTRKAATVSKAIVATPSKTATTVSKTAIKKAPSAGAAKKTTAKKIAAKASD